MILKKKKNLVEPSEEFESRDTCLMNRKYYN